jgi:hypothetical protein
MMPTSRSRCPGGARPIRDTLLKAPDLLALAGHPSNGDANTRLAEILRDLCAADIAVSGATDCQDACGFAELGGKLDAEDQGEERADLRPHARGLGRAQAGSRRGGRGAPLTRRRREEDYPGRRGDALSGRDAVSVSRPLSQCPGESGVSTSEEGVPLSPRPSTGHTNGKQGAGRHHIL